MPNRGGAIDMNMGLYAVLLVVVVVVIVLLVKHLRQREGFAKFKKIDKENLDYLMDERRGLEGELQTHEERISNIEQQINSILEAVDKNVECRLNVCGGTTTTKPKNIFNPLKIIPKNINF